MGDHAGGVDGVGQELRPREGEGDADRGHPHGGAVGGARTAGGAGVGAGADPLQGELGGRAQQVKGAARPHAILPGEECVGEAEGVDAAAAGDEELGDQEGLLGVVGDGAGRRQGRVGRVG